MTRGMIVFPKLKFAAPNRRDAIDLSYFYIVYFSALALMIFWKAQYLWTTADKGLYQQTLIELLLHYKNQSQFIFYVSLALLEACFLFVILNMHRSLNIVLSLFFYINLFGPTNYKLQPFDDNILIPNILVLFFASLTTGKKLYIQPQIAKKIIILNISLVYFSAFLSKFIRSGMSWVSGETLQYYLYERYFQTHDTLTLMIAQNSNLCLTISLLVLMFEATFYLTLIGQQILIIIYIFFAFFMHLGILFIMDINFFRFFFISYLIFIPYSKLISKNDTIY